MPLQPWVSLPPFLYWLPMELPGLCLEGNQLFPINWLCKINLFTIRGYIVSQKTFGDVEGDWLALISHWDVLSEYKESKCSAMPKTALLKNWLVQNVSGSLVDKHCRTVTLTYSGFYQILHFNFLYPSSLSKGKKCSILWVFLKWDFSLPILPIFFFSPLCFSECKAGLTPIFEAQMSLEIPEIVFSPSLEFGVKGGFYDIVEGLITSIFRISSLVPRLSPLNSSPHYQVQDLQPSCLPTYLGLPAKCWCITHLLLPYSPAWH